jgi:DNA polymerase III subunit delta
VTAPSAILLWGEDPYLLRLAAADVLDGVDPREVAAPEWSGGETSDLATPSLFGGRRALLVTDCRALAPEGVRELAGYLSAPDPDATLVLLAVVPERGKAPAALAKLVKPVGEIREVRVARRDLPAWVVARARSHGADIEPAAAPVLVGILGEEPAALDQALAQLATAYAGGRISEEMVSAQFRGLGEQHMWDVCDRAFGRDAAGAMRALGSMLEQRDDPLKILGGIASRVRDLLRIRSLPDRMPLEDVAKAAGLRFDWQARRYRDQARRFTVEELVAVHARVAALDRALKSGADGDIAMPMLIADIAAGGDGATGTA